jgi:Flp pilus assembly secretin CpaC
MRRLLSSLAALLIAAGTAVPSVAAESFSVPLDQSAVLVLPAGAQSVMIGNPAIADVNMLDTRTAVLLGRGYGVTNLLVIDALGRTLMDRQIVVSGSDVSRVSIFRRSPDSQRPEVSNFSCTPRCERTPLPGETDAEFNRYNAPYSASAGRLAEARANGGAKVGP